MKAKRYDDMINSQRLGNQERSPLHLQLRVRLTQETSIKFYGKGYFLESMEDEEAPLNVLFIMTSSRYLYFPSLSFPCLLDIVLLFILSFIYIVLPPKACPPPSSSPPIIPGIGICLGG